MSTEFQSEADYFQWVEIEPGRKRMVDIRKYNQDCHRAEAPSVITFKDHEAERFRKVYGEELVVNYDLASKEAAKTWPKYGKVQIGDHIRGGPLPFESRKERSEYCKRYGFMDA